MPKVNSRADYVAAFAASLRHRSCSIRGVRPSLWLAIFVVLQFADGVMTYAAVEQYGLQAEGNPILATWIAIAGAMPAVFGAKLLACACGGVLYAAGVHRVLAGLATLYFFAAVLPWLHIFSQPVQ
jgi:hypothetical protein